MSTDNTAKRTPGPWDAVEYAGFWVVQNTSYYDGKNLLSYSGNELDVSEDEAKANAAYIVKACNNHDELLAVLKHLVKDVQNKPNDTRYATAIKLAETAIANAEK